jgi:hypothetical protein
MCEGSGAMVWCRCGGDAGSCQDKAHFCQYTLGVCGRYKQQVQPHTTLAKGPQMLIASCSGKATR